MPESIYHQKAIFFFVFIVHINKGRKEKEKEVNIRFWNSRIQQKPILYDVF